MSPSLSATRVQYVSRSQCTRSVAGGRSPRCSQRSRISIHVAFREETQRRLQIRADMPTTVTSVKVAPSGTARHCARSRVRVVLPECRSRTGATLCYWCGRDRRPRQTAPSRAPADDAGRPPAALVLGTAEWEGFVSAHRRVCEDDACWNSTGM